MGSGGSNRLWSPGKTVSSLCLFRQKLLVKIEALQAICFCYFSEPRPPEIGTFWFVTVPLLDGHGSDSPESSTFFCDRGSDLPEIIQVIWSRQSAN